MDAHAKAVEAARLAVNERRGIPVAITAYLAAMRAEGWVMVPVEPTLEMLQDGYDAGRAAYRNGISGMTTDAQTRAQSYREAATYRAMVRAAMLKGATDGQG